MRPAALGPLALVLLLASGCAATRAPSVPGPSAGRASDDLLGRADLQALVEAQVRRDSRPLARGLAHPDAAVRARAAFALGSVQDPGAAGGLFDVLADEAPAVRADAAFALGQSADSTAAVGLLVALRAEATPEVLTELLTALGRVGTPADIAELLAVPLAVGLEADRARAVAAAARRGAAPEAAFAWAAARVSSPDADLRAAAATVFERAPAERWARHAPALREAFAAPRPSPDSDAAAHARMALARSLGRAADTPEDAQALAAALVSEPDARVRVALAGAVGTAAVAAERAGRPDAALRVALWKTAADADAHAAQAGASALARLEPDEATRNVAAALLGQPRPWQATAPLLALVLSDRAAADAWAARHAARPLAQAAYLTALGSARDAASAEILYARAADGDVRLAAAAVEALRARWAARDATLRAEPERAYAAFSAALVRRDLATASAAAPVLADSAFAPLGAPALLREVYAEMRAPEDIEPMTEIVRAVGQTRDGGEVDFLVGVALTGHPVLRAAAVEALNDRLIEGIDVVASGDNPVGGTTSIDWAYLERLGRRPRLVLETERGRVVVEMDAESAPQTVQTLALAAAGGRYDGVPFHRVVANFVVQGGDFFRRDGYGGPPVPIRSEFTRIRYRTGTAGMASAGKDTEGVQFFVTHSPQPHLDGRYTAFGRIVEGQDVAGRILQGEVVRRARVERTRR